MHSCKLPGLNFSANFDPTGSLWVGSTSGLFCFDRSYNKIEKKTLTDLTDVYDTALHRDFIYVCRRHDEDVILERYDRANLDSPAIIITSFPVASNGFIPSITATEERVVNTERLPTGDCIVVHDMSGCPEKKYKLEDGDSLSCVRFLPQGDLLLAGNNRVIRYSIRQSNGKTVWERGDLPDVFSVCSDAKRRGIIYASAYSKKKIYLLSAKG